MEISLDMDMRLKLKEGMYRTSFNVIEEVRWTVPEWVACTSCPFGNLTRMGLIWLYESKLVKEKETWSVASEFNIQELDFVVLRERIIPGEVLVGHEDIDATWGWVGTELPEDGCCIKASKA